MDKENRNKSLIKKADSLIKFDSQKKKGLIVRGLKEAVSRKTIILVFRRNSAWHRLLDEEITDVYGDNIKIIHLYCPKDAFDYLISNKVDLVIAEILFEENLIRDGDKKGDAISRLDFELSGRSPNKNGIQLLNACKTLYPLLPFIMYSSLDYFENWFTKFPDYYLVMSADLSELLEAIKKCLEVDHNTEVVNAKIRAKDVELLSNLGLAYNKLYMYQDATKAYK